MSELIEAAKAVIEKWDLIKPDQVPAYIKELHAAVERAEKQEPIGFKRWCQLNAVFAPNYVQWFESAWTAAQQAEQERIKSLIADIGTSGRNECWDCCETILEKIDE